ncbi:MAG: hypothetical protein N3G20_04980 [Verrucomicrobiae bacterium]|nr:hypothetical protein [Verrucomicrobiae bacterium]
MPTHGIWNRSYQTHATMGIEGITKQLRTWIEIILGVILLLVMLLAILAYARTRIATEVYARRLESVLAEYERLREEYNRAVSRTAVTELRVKGTNVTIAVRTADGVVREFATACRPDREVYVDYLVVDGRLWIRRVFDSSTPPEAGTTVDPHLVGIDWDTGNATVGKAVYRRLTEGRWIVTVSGDGSLGLERVRDSAEVPLAPPPPVLDFKTIKGELESERSKLTWLDLIRELVL